MVPRNWTRIWKAVQMAGRTFRVQQGLGRVHLSSLHFGRIVGNPETGILRSELLSCP
jgi:hypothetical protein